MVVKQATSHKLTTGAFTLIIGIIGSLMLAAITFPSTASSDMQADRDKELESSEGEALASWTQLGANSEHTFNTEAVVAWTNITTNTISFEKREVQDHILFYKGMIYLEAFYDSPYSMVPAHITRKVYSINPLTRSINWEWKNITLGSTPPRLLPIFEGSPAISSSSNSLLLTNLYDIISINLTTGAENWVKNLNLSFEPLWRESIVIRNEIGIVSYRSLYNESASRVIAFNVQTGETLWTHFVNGLVSTPAADENYVIIVDEHLWNITSLDLGTGRVVWSKKLILPGVVVTLADNQVVIRSRSALQSYTTASGDLLWNRDLEENITSMSISDKTIYVGTEKGLKQVSLVDGNLLESGLQIAGNVYHVVSTKEVVIIIVEPGDIQAFDLSTNQLLWTVPIFCGTACSYYNIIVGNDMVISKTFNKTKTYNGRELLVITRGEDIIEPTLKIGVLDNINFLTLMGSITIRSLLTRKNKKVNVCKSDIYTKEFPQ